MARTAAARQPLLTLAVVAILAGCAPPEPSPPAAGLHDFTFGGGIGRRAGGPDLAIYVDWSGAFPPASRETWFQARYSVDSFSRLDEIWPTSTSPAPSEPSRWRRADTEIDVTYDRPAPLGGGRNTIAGFLDRNPTTGLLVAQDGTILLERYQYGRDDHHRFTSFSMAKTLIALLFGIAVSEGHVKSIEDAAEVYASDLRGTEYGRTPLRHLLTMSSGVDFREDYDGNDDSARLVRASFVGQTAGGAAAVRQFNTRGAEPGARWYYASAETFVLAHVLRAAIGRPLHEYFAEKIWRPIGAEADATWLTDRSGLAVGFMGFNARLRDFARLGMMLANGGRAGDRQIVPAAWLAEATRAHFTAAQTRRGFGYGFQTWIFAENDGSYALQGVRGQVLYVDPARRLVLVHTAVRQSARDPGGADTIALWRAIKRATPVAGR